MGDVMEAIMTTKVGVANCRSQREAGGDGGGGKELEEKVKRLELEIFELKHQRIEDARANEKVAGIFATQEQNWIAEKKSLRRQIQALFSQFRVIEAKKEDQILSLSKMLEEKDREIQNKDEEMEKVINESKDCEERLKRMEEVVEELKEKSAKEADEHSGQLLKHKTALVELVSNQCQLEAELGHAVQQVETVKCELDEAIGQKEEAVGAVGRLSEEIVGLQKDGEQKDKILSAMLRKSKFDTAEKRMLLKEVKVSKARRKQAEFEAEHWKTACEPRRWKGSREFHSVEAGCSHERGDNTELHRNGIHTRTLLIDSFEVENTKGREPLVLEDDSTMTTERYRRCSSKETDELVMIDIRKLQDWIQSETEKYGTILEQRHYAEMEAFTDQMRVKDEKLEILQWKLVSTELEVKRLQSHIHGLEIDLSQVKDEKKKVKSLLIDREKDLKSIKDRFTSHVLSCRKNTSNWTNSEFLDPQTLWSEKMMQKQMFKDRERNADAIKELEYVEKEMQLESHGEKIETHTDSTSTTSTILPPHDDVVVLVDQIPGDEIGEEKEVSVDPGHVSKLSASVQRHFTKNSPWKMDINALGVSYKIKRLKQQLVVVEKLTGKDSACKTETCGKKKVDEKKPPVKGFHTLISLLNKQVKRYQSLEDKTNDLCKRMNGNEQEGRRSNESNGKTREQIESLEGFLEETFQLQRYMVATGQKLMEIQSRITCSFINVDERMHKNAGFNMGQFADIVRCLLREIQRGLEVRIARIIGDLAGTLTRDGILHMRL